RHLEALRVQIVMELRVDQMNLAQVRLRRVAPDARAVLHGLPHVGIALHAKPSQEPDAVAAVLRHRMLRGRAHADEDSVQRNTDLPGYWASPPSASSMRSSWLYLATRSVRDGAPVLIWPQPVATARSAIVTSSVSPERCDMTAV